MVAHDEALSERFVAGHGEAAAQLGESDQQQAQAVLAIHGEVTQQAKIFEDVVAQVLGFVDDEHGELLGLAHQSSDFFADGAVGGGARAFGGQPQLPGDGLVHVEDVAGGEGDVDEPVHQVLVRPCEFGLAAQTIADCARRTTLEGPNPYIRYSSTTRGSSWIGDTRNCRRFVLRYNATNTESGMRRTRHSEATTCRWT